MKVLLCTPYLESPGVVSSGIGTWARIIMAYNQETGNEIEIVPVSFDRHAHIEEYTVRSFRRYYSGIIEVGKSVIKALRLMRNERPDIVHVCTSGYLGFIKDIILARAARRRGIRSVIHFHFGRTPGVIQEKGFEYRLLRILLRLADTFIVIDGESYKAFKDHYHANVYYVPNPVTDSFLNEKEKQRYFNGRQSNTAIFVGHVVPTKGVVELVKSCCQIQGLSLRIIGKCSDEMKERLRMLAMKRDNGSWCSFAGEIPHKEVISEMLKADLLVFPSYTEAFPNVVLEAMACGSVIISTPVGAIPELLEEDEFGQYGVLVPPQSVDALADAIHTVSRNDALKAEMRRNSQRRVRERYSISVVWEQLTDVWRGNSHE